jgi:hypothetical protein
MRLEIKKQSTMTGTNRNRRRLPFSRTVKNNTQCNFGRKPSKYKEFSPTTRKVKKAQENVVMDAAFKRLLAIRAANGGKK